ncbi:MAG: hypothetical protein MUD00_00805 [Candidatus Pacebacteria bacterium]|jgi:protein-S-isoprenylcysteine O-methyltransferase Ste14|nr:hypothetical protein [Candidatus Paceibacterota bacterium]
MSDKNTKKPVPGVHAVLAHSYLMYFFAVVAGLLLDLTIPIKIIPDHIATAIGMVFLFAAPALIIWAQMTSHRFEKEKNKTDALNFFKGPYVFTRSPTHLGLDMLVIGFALILNSLFLVVFSLVSFFLTRSIFVRKEERILGQKYGDQYHKYRKSVRA